MVKDSNCENKEKMVKDKVNIFNLNFPIIYYDTDTIITETKDNSLPFYLSKRRYAFEDQEREKILINNKENYELKDKFSKSCKNNQLLYYRNISMKSKNKTLLLRNQDLIKEKKILQRKNENLSENKNFKELYIKEANISINQSIKIETLKNSLKNLNKSYKHLLTTNTNNSSINLKLNKENKRLEVLLNNTTKAYQLITKEYDNFKKGSGCQKIGKLNRIGFRKTYTCREFAKIDKKFTWNLWCNYCQYKNEKNLQLVNEKKILNLIRKGINNYNILSLKTNFDKKTLDEILFDLMLAGKIFEFIPFYYAIL